MSGLAQLRWRRTGVVFLAIAGLLMFVDVVAAQGVADGIVSKFSTVGNAMVSRAQTAAFGVFALCAAIEITTSGIEWSSGDLAPDAIIRQFARKLVVLGFVAAVIQYPQYTIGAVVEGLRAAGALVGGVQPNTASAIFDQGVVLRDTLMRSVLEPAAQILERVVTGPDDASWIQRLTSAAAPAMGPLGSIVKYGTAFTLLALYVVGNLDALIYVVLCALVIQISYMIIAFQFIRAQVELILALSAGVFLLGFGSWRITAGMAEGVIKFAFSAGMRLFFLMIMLGVGKGLTEGWLQDVNSIVVVTPVDQILNATGAASAFQANLRQLWSMTFGVVVYAYFCWTIPATFSGKFTNDIAIGLSNAVKGPS